jgi:hypothetical protein
VTPDQAIALLSVKEWPPQLEHWPPRDKSRWKPGMFLQGIIEAVMTLPRPDGSKKRGDPYPAMYVRRLDTGRLVMFHGWHTAAEDIPAMQPAPTLLFTGFYRGERDNGYEDFKYLVTPYDAPAQAQQTRQAGGRPMQAPPSPAPETGEPSTSPSPVSGSNLDLPSIANTDQAKAYVRAQGGVWQIEFQYQADTAKKNGSLAGLSSLQMWLELITRTWAAQGVTARTRGEAA